MQSGISPLGTAMLSVSLIRLYFKMRSLAVLEVREGEALTYKRKKQHQFLERYIVLQTACVMTVCASHPWELETWWLKAHLSVPQTLEGIPHWAFFFLLRQESTTLLSVCSVSLKISVETRFTRVNQTRQNFCLIFCLHGYKPHTFECLRFA